MSDHFLGLNKGQEGFKYSDFTVGAVSGATDVELRVADAAGLSKKDVVIILEAFERYFENAQQVSVGGFVVSG
jgi:hypothetical protein